MTRILLRGPVPLVAGLLLLGAGAWWWAARAAEHYGDEPALPPDGGLRREALDPDAHGGAPEAEGDDDAGGPTAARLAAREAARREALGLNERALARLDAGDTARAVELLGEAVALQPEDEAFRVNLSRAWVRHGRAHLDAGRLDAALDAFGAATGAHPDRGLPAYWEAQTHLRRGARGRAREVVEAALAAHPGEPALWRASGDLAWVRGDLDAAVEAYRAAVARAPEDEALARRLDQLEEERRAYARFLTDRTAHFDVRYDPADEDMVRWVPDLRRDLEAAWSDVIAGLGVQPRERILVLFLDAERYRGDAPAWSRGLYDGRIRLVVEDYARERERIRDTLRHELTHAVLHTLDAEVPTWLHEGMAQILEGADPTVARAWLREREVLRLGADRLDDDWSRWTERARVTEAYFLAVSLCAWLQEEYGEGVLVTLFQNAAHRSFDQAWAATFAAPFAEIERRHRAWLRG